MITYRNAKIDDAKDLNWLLTLLLQDEKQYDDGLNEKFVVTNMYEHYIDDPNRFILVACDEDKIVGYIYSYIRNTSDLYEKKVAKLDALYVMSDYRHQGIANELVSSFKKWAFSKDVKQMEVSVCSANQEAKELYTKYGFLPFKEILSGEIKE